MASTEQDPYSPENLQAIETKLGIRFNNRELLKTAIATNAAKEENPLKIEEHNERLSLRAQIAT